MHQAPADANSCLSINSMAMNILSALQYLKVCLSHTEFEVESTTCTRSVTIYAALSLQIKPTDADGLGDGLGESPGWRGIFGIRMRC